MALHLITGYAGSEHITSKDQGAYNMATFGSGNFVLDRGEKFKNAVASNNSITIYDGEAMLQGRFIKMPSGTTESVTIENGASGQTRNDLICIRYTKNTTNNTESASLVVIKGTPNGGDPSYNTGLITDGDANVSDFPLYRVSLNGINIASVTALFSVKVSMTTYMSNYQMPNATSTSKGAVQIGSGINVSNGVISVPTPTPYSLPTASASTLGGVKVGNNLSINNGVLSLSNAYIRYETREFSVSELIPAGVNFSSFEVGDLSLEDGESLLLANVKNIEGLTFYSPGGLFVTNIVHGRVNQRRVAEISVGMRFGTNGSSSSQTATKVILNLVYIKEDFLA